MACEVARPERCYDPCTIEFFSERPLFYAPPHLLSTKFLRAIVSHMRVPYRKPGKYSNLAPDPFLTEAKFLELEAKLKRLKTIDRPHYITEVKRLAELGDFSENVEYQLAKGKLRGINSAVEKIENQLKDAEIIRPQTETGTVQIGHTVTVETGGQRKTFQILGSTETNPLKGIISYSSPIGVALLGRVVGEVIAVKLPGREVEYKILKIETR